jgi:hypothetical protein
MRASWTVRVVRAAVFAVMCVALAVAAHRLSMGGAPPPSADGWAFLGVLAVVCPLCGRERSFAAIGSAMLTVQVALHVAFDVAQTRQAPRPMRGMAMPAHHAAHSLTVHAAVAHLLAALVASWWLRLGETALWSLLRRRAAMLVPALTAWWSVPHLPSLRAPRLSGTWSVHRSAPRLLLRHALCRRGPPAPAPPRVLCA